MKARHYMGLMILAGGVFLSGDSLWAQVDNVEPVDTENVKPPALIRDGTDSLAVSPAHAADERDGRILSSDQVKDLVDPVPEPSTDVRPPRPEYREIPPELSVKLRDFQRLRERFLREQERLIKLYKGATAAERDMIRQRLQLRREEWLERSQSIKENSRERLRDLMRELPKHREALDAARDAARDQLNDVRRRGVDE